MFDLYFVANLGGTFGICVGASILTLIEFMEFLILSLSKILLDKLKRKTNITTVSAFTEK